LKIGITTSGKNQKEVLAAALKVAVKEDLLFDSFQVTYNLFEQSTFEILSSILKQGKTVIIKEALANGRVFQNKKFHHYQAAYDVLESLSKKYDVGIDAIALRFVIDNLGPTYILSGVSNLEQLKENLKAQNFELSKEEIELIKSLQVPSKRYWEERSALAWN
jgi:aryl-alcohol dehydrogenase-like predicted oxidoreductase